MNKVTKEDMSSGKEILNKLQQIVSGVYNMNDKDWEQEVDYGTTTDNLSDVELPKKENHKHKRNNINAGKCKPKPKPKKSLVRTNKNYKFIDIRNESERSYVFSNGVVTIKHPIALNIGKVGHNILDKAGEVHYIPEGWLQIKMKIKSKHPQFVI